jgi:lysozyme
MVMEYSKDGLQLTEKFEGCRLLAYKDSAGVPTIGYGHTRGVRLGMTCTQQQAEEWLQLDVKIAETVVNHVVKVPLTQHEFDALVDFEFNTGGLTKSTMLKLLNEGKIEAAAEEFHRWDMAGGKHLAGLLKRRLFEKQQFLTPDGVICAS